MRWIWMAKVALLCAALGMTQTANAEVTINSLIGTVPVPDPKVEVIPLIHTAAAPAPVVHPSAPVVQPPAPAILPAAPPPGPHPGGCPAECAPKKKLCVHEVEKRPHIDVKYRCKCKTICLPDCAGCMKKKDCGGCEATCEKGCEEKKECGKPREVRRLWKRFVKEDHCHHICVPVDAPPCTKDCAPACAPSSAPACPAPGAVVAPPQPAPSVVQPVHPPEKLPPGR